MIGAWPTASCPPSVNQLYLMPPSLNDWQAERPPGAVLLRRGRRARLVGLLRALQETHGESHRAVAGPRAPALGTTLGGEEPGIGNLEFSGWRPCGRRRAGADHAARSYSRTMPPRTSRPLTLPPVFEITGWGTGWASPRPRCGRASLCRRKFGCGGSTSRRSPPSAQLVSPRDQRVHPMPARGVGM